MNLEDFSKMTPAEFEAWKVGNTPSTAGSPAPAMAEPEPASPPAPAQEVRPAAEVWGSVYFDFVCPSGAQCRMKKLMPEALIEHGILDQITALPGIVAEVVDKAEGAPPKPGIPGIPGKEELRQITDVLEILIPMVVDTPKVYPVPVSDEEGVVPERVVGRIYTDSIELTDRIAIMERAVGGVKRFESFRAGPGQSV